MPSQRETAATEQGVRDTAAPYGGFGVGLQVVVPRPTGTVSYHQIPLKRYTKCSAQQYVRSQLSSHFTAYSSTQGCGHYSSTFSRCLTNCGPDRFRSGSLCTIVRTNRPKHHHPYILKRHRQSTCVRSLAFPVVLALMYPAVKQHLCARGGKHSHRLFACR